MYIAFSVRVAALALDAPVKWIDNVLSHYELPGVSRTTHGVARQLDDDALLALALCKMLAADLGVPLARAAALAREILSSRGSQSVRVTVAPGIVLDLALEEIERRVRARAADASEAVAHVRRGRPPRLRPFVE